jgi:hypothetical protein
LRLREESGAVNRRKIALPSLFHWLAKWQVVLVCTALTVAFIVFFSSADRAAPEGTPGIVELELAFSKDRFSAIVDQWSAAGTLPLQKRNLRIDFFFPFAYAVLLCSVLTWLTKGGHEEWARGFVILLALPFGAGLLDWVENVLLLMLLRDTSSLSQSAVFVASAVSLIKWVLLLVTVLCTFYYALRRLVGLVRRGSGSV